MPDGCLRVVVACEDAAHFALATYLADAVIKDEAAKSNAAWVLDNLDHLRRYDGSLAGAVTANGYYPLTAINEDARTRRVRVHGHIHGRPQEPESAVWRKCFLLFALHASPEVDVLIVMRDTDGDEARHGGLVQALASVGDVAERVVAGTPHQDAEAWFVAGFVPQTEDERKRYDRVRETLSLDPTREPHRLTAKPNDAARDAKRVLRTLLSDEDVSRPPSAEELPDLCARTLSSLEILLERGHDCGLTCFLDRLREMLAPRVLAPS